MALGSSSYRDMNNQHTVAGSDTTDNTAAVAAALQKSLYLLSDTAQPRNKRPEIITHKENREVMQ